MNQSEVSILRPWEIQLCPANATHSMFLKRGAFVLTSPFGAGGTKGAPDDEDVDIEPLPIDDTFSASLSAAAKQVKDKMRGETVDSGEQTLTERPLNWSSLQRGTTLTRDPISKALFNGYCVNESMSTVKLPFNNSWFYVPPNSAFLISDISRFMFKSTNERFDLVIADPPWPNLSAARSNAYETMDPYALFKIPLQNHLSHDAVVGVWITHKAKYRA
ncbi:Methyltransferase-like protein 4, partial [Rhizoclosmatium hyalinum]